MAQACLEVISCGEKVEVKFITITPQKKYAEKQNKNLVKQSKLSIKRNYHMLESISQRILIA